MIGGDLRISFDAVTSLGGAGWVLVTPLRIDDAGTGTALELAVAYGGVLLERRLSAPGTTSLGLRILIGSGNAKVSLPVVDTEIAADNFGVVEPEIYSALGLGGRLELRAQLGYRLVYGVEDLPQVAPGHLRGATLTVSASVGPF